MNQVEDIVEERWDIRKVIIGVIVIGGFCCLLFFGLGIDKKLTNFSQKLDSSPAVKGVQTMKGVPIAENVEKQFSSIKQQVAELNVGDIASSSPQIKKIIQDLQTLQQYPITQARTLCQQICSNL